MQYKLFKAIRFCSFALLTLVCKHLDAQEAPTSIDLALSFAAFRSIQVNSAENFWAKGGVIELGADAFRGFGLGARVEGLNTASIGSTGTPLSFVVTTFGPRYRWHDQHRLSAFGEGLLGEANAFGSLFPSTSGAHATANSMALHVGGAVDLHVKRHIAIRVVDASWLRTQLPNSISNTQNSLIVSAGVILKIGHQ